MRHRVREQITCPRLQCKEMRAGLILQVLSPSVLSTSFCDSIDLIFWCLSLVGSQMGVLITNVLGGFSEITHAPPRCSVNPMLQSQSCALVSTFIMTYHIFTTTKTKQRPFERSSPSSATANGNTDFSKVCRKSSLLCKPLGGEAVVI